MKVDIGILARPVAYNDEAKRKFHSHAAAVLRSLARELGYEKGEFDLRHNQGGIAVSGEITLHSDTLYVQLAQHGFMWRTCKSRRDYTGGMNHFEPWESLLDLPRLAQRMGVQVLLMKGVPERRS